MKAGAGAGRSGPRREFVIGDTDVNPYALLVSLVVPRPIAWISTVSGDGVGNLSPHSFYGVAAARPPMVHFTSVGLKDTLRNVRETGEFVVNVASEPFIDQVNDSSASWANNVDEATELGIVMEDSLLVGPRRVAESPASIECRLYSEVDLGQSVLVIGEAVAITVSQDVMEGDHAEIGRLRPLSRLGRDEWGLTPQVVRRRRPR